MRGCDPACVGNRASFVVAASLFASRLQFAQAAYKTSQGTAFSSNVMAGANLFLTG